MFEDEGDFAALEQVLARSRRAKPNAAAAVCQFRLIAFVFMPERVDLLVRPTRADTAVDNISWFLVGRHAATCQKSLPTLCCTRRFRRSSVWPTYTSGLAACSVSPKRK